MAAAVEEKPAGEAFGEPFLEQKGRGTEEEGADFSGGVGVPEAFDFFAPAADFLNFVEDEPGGRGGGGCEACCGIPLGFNPFWAWREGFVGAGVVAGQPAARGRLAGGGGFADLAGADEDLESAG